MITAGLVLAAIREVFAMSHLVSIIGVVLTGSSLLASTYYVDAERPDDGGDGLSWAAAKRTIQAAVDVCVDGNAVVVTNGTYEPFVTANKSITLSSVNGPDVTVVDAAFMQRCATLGEAGETNSVLVGFTLTQGTADYGGGVSGGSLRDCQLVNNCAYWYGGGAYGSTSSDCFFQENWAACGGGGAYQGRLRHCELLNNSVADLMDENHLDFGGGGANGAVLDRCQVSDNSSATYGGGTHASVVNNCLLISNSASWGGGAANECALTNCTVTGNNGDVEALRESTVNNCIAWGNTRANGALNNYGECTLTFTCSAPLADGVGNICIDPLFVSASDGNYHVQLGSPCIDAGDNASVVGAVDCGGRIRLQGAAVDMGAFEGAEIAIAGPSQVIATDGEFADVVRVSWTAVSAATHYRVYRGNDQFDTPVAVSDWMPTLSYVDAPPLQAKTYFYWVSAAQDEDGFGKSPVNAFDGGFRRFTPMWFVDCTRADDEGDGRSWITAKKSIQAAVDAAIDGDSICVTSGVYSAISTDNKAVAIIGMFGAGSTVIDGENVQRCATLGGAKQNATFLSGITIRNGMASSGGGVCGGCLENCYLYDNHAQEFGGAASYSTLNNCVVSNNTLEIQYNNGGGGCYHCRLVDANVILNRSRAFGGGIAGGAAYRCKVEKNSAVGGGGGATDGALLVECFIGDNYSFYDGGGVYRRCSLTRCVLLKNSAGYGGGGAAAEACALYNCLLVENGASKGGGAEYCDLMNCTLVRNTAISSGGGTYACEIANCVFESNCASLGNDNHIPSSLYDYAEGSGCDFSCLRDVAVGVGNLTADPMLVNPSNGCYRLALTSPCIDRGTNDVAIGEMDVAGQVRIANGTVDMGAYEALPANLAINSSNLVWSSGGSAYWFCEREVSADGSGAAQSGPIGDNQVAWLEGRAAGKGTFDFKWKVSSEPNRDFLRFYVDGLPNGSISGDPGWQAVSLSVTNVGSHTFRWEYVKGKSGTAGSDSSWIDQVSWSPMMAILSARAEPLEGGTVSGTGVCVVGTSVVLSAAPNRGWRFDRWESGDVSAKRTVCVPDAGAAYIAYFVRDAIPLADAVDATNILWTTGGDTGWNGWVSRSAHDEDDVAQSGAIRDDEVSFITTTVIGPGVLAFWWRASCEEDYDYLDFDIDGLNQSWLTGNTGWQYMTYKVDAGAHMLEWVYWKDESYSDGDDSGWVDQVTWTPDQPILTGFSLWLAGVGLSGDVSALFQQDRNGDGIANGFEYAYGTNLNESVPLLRIFMVDGQPIVETPLRDLSTTNDVAVAVQGCTNLVGNEWTVPVGPVVDSADKPVDREWFTPIRDVGGRAFFRLRAVRQ